ncbi:MAG: carbamoyl-phosphate synthase (glutamine-hydrolyzing) large subunit [Fervidicoccaceae archaeon]
MELPKKVLLIGSGAIKIAEAAEFDYSGSQALKALAEEGIETVLVNPNVATIQTSHKLADRVYLVPIQSYFLEKVIERERPDGIMIGFGGQAALSAGVELSKRGVLGRYGVRVLGTPIEGVEKALNREKFKETMKRAGLPVPPSGPATSVEEALRAADLLGYPVIVRVSFNLGGRGSFIAWNREEFERRLFKAFAHSGIGLVLVEKYLHHWKEVEFEVVRDSRGNSVAVACLENADPMGVHTGDSIVIAPCQTLTDYEYQTLRLASIGVANAIDLIGECNVQLALDPKSSESYYVIETNPRMSRSSALASKATGYPLAYIAAKLALGYTLDEVINKVTGVTCSCFEPSLDYVVVKVPRWDLEKFEGVSPMLGSEMMSVGEVMAIGRNLHEAFQKAFRMLDIGEPGVVGGDYYYEDEELEKVMERLRRWEPYWPLHAAKALRLGATVEEVSRALGVDKFFVRVIEDLVSLEQALRNARGNLEELMWLAKEYGFSDEQIARATGLGVEEVAELRKKLELRPRVKQIDTLAAEWPAVTNYLYVTYGASEDDVPRAREEDRNKVLIVGAGVFRIGVSVEFDWAVVTLAQALRARGVRTVVLNYNPETVSTDWDVNDTLYFDEISLERVLDVYEHEKFYGVVAFAGGQIANNLAKKMQEKGLLLLGTSGHSVHVAEARHLFSELVERLGLKQPPWTEASSVEEALRFAEETGYPVIVRPSYVLSGSAMKIARNAEELRAFLEAAARVSPSYPVVVSKFFERAREVEIDAVSDSSRVVGVVLEHIEPAGVHSGDATMVTPPRTLDDSTIKQMHEAAVRLASELEIRGPFNIQFLVRDGQVSIIELNLRASRSMPFSSKSRGVNLMELAADVIVKGSMDLGEPGVFYEIPANSWAVKSPQFSWAQLRGSYPALGPEMRSTGEVASLDRVYEAALLKSWLSATPNRLLREGEAALVYAFDEDARRMLEEAADALERMGVETLTLEEAEVQGLERVNRAKALGLLAERRVGLVLTSGHAPSLDYKIRRAAADLNVPLVLDSHLAAELARAMMSLDLTDIEVRELSEYWSEWARRLALEERAVRRERIVSRGRRPATCS